MQPGDQFVLGIALAKIHRQPKVSCDAPALCLDIIKRFMTVNFWLPFSEQVQIGSIENKDVVDAHHRAKPVNG
jgi:hypothetical protein